LDCNTANCQAVTLISSMVTEYRDGSISDIIAKSSGSGFIAFDPKLASIFGGGTTEQKPKTWRKVQVTQSTPGFSMTIPKAQAAVQRTEGRRGKVKVSQDNVKYYMLYV